MKKNTYYYFHFPITKSFIPIINLIPDLMTQHSDFIAPCHLHGGSTWSSLDNINLLFSLLFRHEEGRNEKFPSSQRREGGREKGWAGEEEALWEREGGSFEILKPHWLRRKCVFLYSWLCGCLGNSENVCVIFI